MPSNSGRRRAGRAARQPVGAVDVEPRAMRVGDVGELAIGSTAPALTVPALATTATGTMPRRAVGGDRARRAPRGRPGRAHRRARRRGRGAQAEDAGGAVDDVVRLVARVDAAGGGAGDAVARGVDAEPLVGVLARRAEADEVRRPSRRSRTRPARRPAGRAARRASAARALEVVEGLQTDQRCAPATARPGPRRRRPWSAALTTQPEKPGAPIRSPWRTTTLVELVAAPRRARRRAAGSGPPSAVR